MFQILVLLASHSLLVNETHQNYITEVWTAEAVTVWQEISFCSKNKSMAQNVNKRVRWKRERVCIISSRHVCFNVFLVFLLLVKLLRTG